jgi:hypothetical protein
MKLSEQLKEYVCACFTGLWIESHEHDEALAEMAALCRQEGWTLAVWDIEQGLRQAGPAASETGGNDPLAAIRTLGTLATPDNSTLLVLVNFHRFLNSAEIVQALARQITLGKQQRTFVVILSPLVQIPVELEKLFVVIEHELPSREQLEEIARGIATEEGELPADTMGAVLDSAAGLTRYEAEGAFSLSLVRHGRLTSQAIFEQKSQTLKKSGLLSLYRGTETFADLGGLDALKSFCTRAVRRQSNYDPLRRPRGVLLLSPPGCGKSQFAKALGNEVGRPTLTLDVGALLGSLVGQSEQNIRQALRIADAMAPAVLYCDELEKALSGVNGTGDSGVSARLFGTLLTWLNDHESDVFFVGTCNDISRLPPEFARAERFDGLFMIDLPGPKEKQAIWRMYLDKYGLDAQQTKPAHDLWTGAEIKSCCRLAALLEVSLVEAATNVVPVAKTASEAVDKLRAWASGRCLSADRPGIYTSPSQSTIKPGRKISRDPSNN